MERVLGDLRYAPRRITMCEECGCGEHKVQNNTFEEKVKIIIDAIRPNLQSHGGDVEFVSTEKGSTVKVRLQGACSGCPSARATLKVGIERLLKDKIPQVKEVIAVD
jgi:Fe-S cluster biogenesis protein NfuA